MILNKRQVIIMQGLSGSGKTSWVGKYHPDATVVSADSYFTRSGKYEFDPKQLGRAHARCLSRFIRALDRGNTTIVVDNTNAEKWEWCNYTKLATHWGYKWSVVDMMQDPKLGLFWLADMPESKVAKAFQNKVLAERNVHGVSAEAIAKQRERYTHARPEELYSEV